MLDKEDKILSLPPIEIETHSTLKADHTPTPWYVDHSISFHHVHASSPQTAVGDEFNPIASVRRYNLGAGGYQESDANTEFIVSACNAHDALYEACQFVKSFLNKLEDDGGYFDPLTEARKKFHAPLHAKLDAALALCRQGE